MNNSDNVIEINNLCKEYEGFSLDNVTFCVPKGCVMGFVGQNGAGKSTTIKSILNIIKRDSGSISIFGLDNIKEEKAIKDNIGVVFDDLFFHECLKPKEIGLMFSKIYSKWDMEKYNSYLAKFKLPLIKKCGEFSRGMKMKLQIAVALSHNARLLIMDEPTSGLDPVVRNEILDIFMEYVQDEENTIILSSHIISDLERIADYITFIDNGKVLFCEEKYELLDKYGIIKCSKDEADKIDKQFIVSKRQSKFGAEIMVNDKSTCKDKYKDMLLEDASIEDIILFHSLSK